jgi:hypothetical protein
MRLDTRVRPTVSLLSAWAGWPLRYPTTTPAGVVVPWWGAHRVALTVAGTMSGKDEG